MQPPEMSDLGQTVHDYLDPDWYLRRYPDIARSGDDPHQHFVHYGAAEKRDPNGFFDSAWYIEHNPDVAASGLHPLLHYAQSGAAELRNPHPHFDAVYYVQQHPDAAADPLRYHLDIGAARGYPTEKALDITDYLPSKLAALPQPRGIFVDVVIPLHRDFGNSARCIRSVLADRGLPLARIIVVDDRATDPGTASWLRELAEEGQIHLIRNPHRKGLAASVSAGLAAAEEHDVALLTRSCEVSAGWLHRLMAHARAQPDVATVSPLSDHAAIIPHADANGAQALEIDQICQTVNLGRAVDAATPARHCVYLRHPAGLTLATDDTGISWQPASGRRHLVACDGFVGGEPSYHGDEAVAFKFAATAALFRQSRLPVILMITHSFGGGVRRHIATLVKRYRDKARILLLVGTDRGTTLSVATTPDHPVLTLPADRLDDLVAVLRSTGLTRIHIHHLLQMDMDIRALVYRLGVPFDVTVHDYYAICPQINLLRWEEGLYCGEPGPAECNSCIADKSSHGARDIVSWRHDNAWQFLHADRVICPSVDVKLRLERHGLGEHAVVVPHERQTDPVWATSLPEFTSPRLRIVLLGVLASHKGARAVAELAEIAEPGTIELHLAGDLESSFPPPARNLIKVTGRYQEDELPALLRRIRPHVFWFPSSAPETYSYTLSTAIATGLPIVATDLGSFPDRLHGRPLSWLVDHRASAPEWLATFDLVRTALRNPVKKSPAPRAVEALDFYADRYLSPSTRPVRRTSQKPRIAIVPERYDTGSLTACASVRLMQPLDHPAIGGGFEVILATAETVFDYDADVILTQRYAMQDPQAVDRLAAHARQTGAKLLYDLDDDLLNLPRAHPDAALLHPFRSVVQRMLTVADTVWVSTPGLAEHLAPIRPDAVVIENRLDERIWVHQPASRPLWDDPVRILCMGTTSHTDDFAMIAPALLRLKAEYGDLIEIDVLGMTSRADLPSAFNRIGPSTHASRSYPGFVNWLTAMQPRWHIGLAPLLDTEFNRSKSPLKAMDYAALGLTVLASDTPVYRGSLADGPAGQLVRNDPSIWQAALDWLIRNQSLRASGSAQARAAFLAQGTLASQAALRLDAWRRLLLDRNIDATASLRPTPLGLTIPHDEAEPVTRKRRNRR